MCSKCFHIRFFPSVVLLWMILQLKFTVSTIVFLPVLLSTKVMPETRQQIVIYKYPHIWHSCFIELMPILKFWYYNFFFLDCKVLSDVRRIVCDGEYVPVEPRELCGLLFVTCYMGSENSSQETKKRALSLAEQIGRWAVMLSLMMLWSFVTGVDSLHDCYVGHCPLSSVYW